MSEIGSGPRGLDFTYRYPFLNACRLFSFFPFSFVFQFAEAEMNSYTKASRGGGKNSKKWLPGVQLIHSGLLLNL